MPMASLFVARTGVQSHIKALTVVSDNVANLNTVGFKASRAEFVDILPTGFIGEQIGRGTFIGRVRPLHTQGTIEFTDVATDLAVDGEGFFVVKDIPRFGIFYTRNGQFEVDKDGFLVNKLVDGRTGLRVQGWQAVEDFGDGTIRRVGPLADIQIPAVMSPPKKTENARVEVNLDSRIPVISSPPYPLFDADDSTTYHYNTAITVYDTLGNPHTVNLFFRKISEADPAIPGSRNVWEVLAEVDNGTISSPPPNVFGAPVIGTLEFDTEGKLAAEKLTTGAVDKSLNIQVTWSGGQPSTPQTINIDFGTSLDEVSLGLTLPKTDVKVGLDGTTHFASPFVTNFLTQDGYGVGSLLKFTVGEDGLVTGFYSNGQQRPIAFVALARFVNNEGLLRVGRTLWVQTPESGEALIDLPTLGGRGKVLFKSLEQANVDLANEFINMIVYQRAFQGSSRMIGVSDNILVELAGLVR